MLKQTDLTEKLYQGLSQMKEFDSYWQNQANQIYEAKLAITDPVFITINHIRQAIRFYLIPALESALGGTEWEQKQFIDHHSLFFNQERMNQFLRHFYWIIPASDGGWRFLEPDIYQQDNQILYDLYKIKKTIKGIKYLLKYLLKERIDFPSRFSLERRESILKGMASALFVVFKQVVKQEYQVELYKKVSLDYVDEDRVYSRKKQGLRYSKPANPGCNPYRRVFLYILFRDSLTTTINREKIVIKYNLFDFEQLLHEYFEYYQTGGSEDTNAKMIYHSLHFQSKSLTEYLIKDIDQENLFEEEIDNAKVMIQE